jgi:2-polyprenyl-6-methoxyphenol hydroxylase-like FAD-dependent oxidoreductase
MSVIGGHAIVVGASMAGLLTARVLSEHYGRVTVVERDALTDDAEPRRGVPQSRQPHLLLARCGQIAEELFPGLLDELVADGAHRWDTGDLSRFLVYFGGHRVAHTGTIPDPRSVVNHFASRPFIEQHVRRRVLALHNVTLLDGHDLLDLTVDTARVTGVRIERRGDGAVSQHAADLVVDASGRGSRTPTFLQQRGYGRPRTYELAVRVAYASMPVRIPDGAIHEQLIFRLFEPGRRRGFVMSQCERDVWSVCAATLGELRLPSTLAEMLEFGADTVPEPVLSAAANAEPLAGVSIHRYPCNRWRRYDRMSRFPTGFVVVGDAYCSFNPIYGQGMTVAAIEATILRDCLERGRDADLAQRFYAVAAKNVALAWQTAVGSDLALPEIEGDRSMSMRITNAYLDKVLRAAETDTAVAQDFMRVTGMLEPPRRLLRPSFMARVIRANTRRRSGLEASSPTVGLAATG